MNQFLLVGNAPYLNRGCEAIVRGTMKILRKSFGDDVLVTNASFGPRPVLEEQAKNEKDPAITNVHLDGETTRFSKRWLLQRLNQRLGASIGMPYPILDTALNQSCAALEVGGDNYSLDYGEPWSFLELDWYLESRGIPVSIWGASVGPFSANPGFEYRAKKHFNSLDGIFVRETATQKYLSSIGVSKNVYLTSDPSFAMDAEMPSREELGFSLPQNAVGLNLSPLMAKYVTGGNKDRWIELSIQLVSKVRDALDMPVFLIPHVSAQTDQSSDYLFMQHVVERVSDVFLTPDTLNAEKTKGLIAGCSLFCGARTHSTLAAISTCVPTLSLAYSIKARGLNQDVFDSQDFCVDPKVLTPEIVVEKLLQMKSNQNQIREQLQERVPILKAAAYQSGETLKQLITNRNA